MESPYLVRTAAVVTLAAAAFTAGWMGTGHDDEMQIPAALVSASNSGYEPAVYFPAGYELKPNPAEPEVFEY
jgi:hypothetical protein